MWCGYEFCKYQSCNTKDKQDILALVLISWQCFIFYNHFTLALNFMIYVFWFKHLIQNFTYVLDLNYSYQTNGCDLLRQYYYCQISLIKQFSWSCASPNLNVQVHLHKHFCKHIKICLTVSPYQLVACHHPTYWSTSSIWQCCVGLCIWHNPGYAQFLPRTRPYPTLPFSWAVEY